jgi:MFS family permease
VLCQSFAVGSFYIFVTGVPFVATQTWGLSPALTGLGLGSITAGFMLGAAITSRTASRVGFAPLILAGRLAAALGLATGLAILLLGIVHPLVLFGFTLFVGLGNGLTLPSANAGALSVRPDLAGTAAGLNGALTIGTGAVLTWATAFVIDRAATPTVLIALMLASAVLALIAGLVATRMDPGAS